MESKVYSKQFLFHINKYYGQEPLTFGAVNLVQIGRMFCNNTTVIPTHVHMNWFELTIVKGGRGEIETNGQRVPVKEGDIYFSLPCDAHAIYSDERDPLKYDFFSFFTSDEEKNAQLEALTSEIYPADKRIVQDEKISYLVACAIDEINSEREGSAELLTSIFAQLIIYVIRALQGQSTATASHKTGIEVLCFKVMYYLDTHIYSLKNLYELTDIANYNYSYLSYVFKQTTGVTIADYFRNKKLEAAMQLIKEGKLKIGEIAAILNYSSIYAFSKAFKNRYGTSPSGVK